MTTLICRSMQSFLDLCDNKLILNINVHCTFPTKHTKWMNEYFLKKGGHELSFSPESLFVHSIDRES